MYEEKVIVTNANIYLNIAFSTSKDRRMEQIFVYSTRTETQQSR